jgi:hypothetical protein
MKTRAEKRAPRAEFINDVTIATYSSKISAPWGKFPKKARHRFSAGCFRNSGCERGKAAISSSMLSASS